MEIRTRQPLLDEHDNIVPKQECCATCKKRMKCKMFYDVMEENKRTNEYAEIALSLYYICDNYSPMFIQYPIVVESIVSDSSFDSFDMQTHVGKFVLISLNLKNYDEDPHLGLYLGELPLSIISLFDPKTKTVRNKFMSNPGIFVFKFNKVFYGNCCRWQFIENINDLNVIKDDPPEYMSIAKNKFSQ